MLAALRARQPGAPVGRILGWYALHLAAFYWMTACYRYRAWGVENIPESGPVLLVSNHQSYLDPMLVGVGGHRRQFYAMARSTLFRNKAFSGIIRFMNAVAVERGTADMTAMRRCIELLQQGNALLIYPEGTRTLDGKTGPFATGTMLLIKRAKPRVVPVAIEGSFQAWPKGRSLPRPTGRIGVMYGEPIDAETLINRGATEGLEHLRQTIEAMRLELARRMAR
ncbi:MAG: lysophospholipid acyltransferase family protein [Planctomycetota bacterium]|nr:lysophospholipid acyltransferase family protein [Planctomycetota bacterium]